MELKCSVKDGARYTESAAATASGSLVPFSQCLDTREANLLEDTLIDMREVASLKLVCQRCT